jgi:catechol 2,3-dioxygenase-like lactoylglutathione lyase family enzyme
MTAINVMRLGHIELFVRDPLVSLAFYHDVLGFDVVDVQQDTFVWLRSGDVELLLRPGTADGARSEYWQAPAGIVLYTNDLPSMRSHLESCGIRFQGTDGSDGCLTFTDPDNHWFQLVDPTNH